MEACTYLQRAFQPIQIVEFSNHTNPTTLATTTKQTYPTTRASKNVSNLGVRAILHTCLTITISIVYVVASPRPSTSERFLQIHNQVAKMHHSYSFFLLLTYNINVDITKGSTQNDAEGRLLLAPTGALRVMMCQYISSQAGNFLRF